MANGNFVVQNGLTVGPLTIDAATGSISTSGTVTISGGLGGVTQISKNDTSISINDTGTGSNVLIAIDGVTEHTLTQYLTTLNGNLYVNTTTAATSSTTGALQVAGGAGIAGNVYIGGITSHTGNVSFDGQQVTHYDSIIDLHTYGNLAAWASDDGKDIGLRMHYYNGVDSLAFLGLENTSKTLQFLINATETSSNVTGTFGNAQLGSLTLSNSTVSSSTTTGALVVAGGAGISGAVYAGSIQNTPIGSTTASTGAFTTGTFSSTLGVTGATTLTTATTGGLQAVAIGNVTPGTGAFTTLTNNGATTHTSNTQSTSTSTGAVVITGGTAITTGNLYIGGSAGTAITHTGHILPSANITYNLGSTTSYYNNIYGITFVGTSTTAKYADLAENYQGDRPYMAGQVVMFGGEKEVTLADADTTRVAGVVSTNPAHLMNGGLTGNNVVPLALQGRVPCLVIGPVAKGDIMVSAGFGYAKTNNSPLPGQTIGKALENFNTQGKGLIEVVVGRI